MFFERGGLKRAIHVGRRGLGILVVVGARYGVGWLGAVAGLQFVVMGRKRFVMEGWCRCVKCRGKEREGNRTDGPLTF